MQYSNIAYIMNAPEKNWKSCNSIRQGILRSHELFRSAHSTTYTDYDGTTESSHKIAQTLFDSNHDCIVFIDHQPHPLPLIEALKNLYETRKLPAIIFYVYGDFTLFTPEWHNCESLLSGAVVKFICSSRRQQNLIRAFCKQPQIVYLLPFFPNTQIFKFDQSKRLDFRRTHNLQDDDFVFIYTGRISAQKNVARLIKEFIAFNKKNPRTYLYILGTFDNLDAPFFGIYRHIVTYKEYVMELANSHRHIVFSGEQDLESVSNFLCGSDCFLSLSTHHDEDFGMSVAESLMTGTPAILSDWGGFASFQVHDQVQLCPIKIESNGLILSSADIQAAMEKLYSFRATNISNRQALSQLSLRYLSDSNSREQIHNILTPTNENFLGFTELLNSHACAVLISRSDRNIFPLGPQPKGLYWDIYSHYIKDT